MAFKLCIRCDLSFERITAEDWFDNFEVVELRLLAAFYFGDVKESGAEEPMRRHMPVCRKIFDYLKGSKGLMRIQEEIPFLLLPPFNRDSRLVVKPVKGSCIIWKEILTTCKDCIKRFICIYAWLC
jgi:hypothetical protein